MNEIKIPSKVAHHFIHPDARRTERGIYIQLGYFIMKEGVEKVPETH
jgi:hypothetical protein